MEKLRQEFHAALADALALFESITESESSARPTHGTWTAKEVLGHLIDSATQNHRRFVELYGPNT